VASDYDKDLTLPAAALARSAPREWKAFIEAFKKYGDRQRDAMMAAARDELEKSQGRAQQCALLTPLLEDAVTSADRVHSKPGGP
jgi:hypothetical protein